jgi:hypothetical protein
MRWQRIQCMSASTPEDHQVDCIAGRWGQDAFPLMELQHDRNLGEFLAHSPRQHRYQILCRAAECQFHRPFPFPEAAPFCHCSVALYQVGNNGKHTAQSPALHWSTPSCARHTFKISENAAQGHPDWVTYRVQSFLLVNFAPAR